MRGPRGERQGVWLLGCDIVDLLRILGFRLRVFGLPRHDSGENGIFSLVFDFSYFSKPLVYVIVNRLCG